MTDRKIHEMARAEIEARRKKARRDAKAPLPELLCPIEDVNEAEPVSCPITDVEEDEEQASVSVDVAEGTTEKDE